MDNSSIPAEMRAWQWTGTGNPLTLSVVPVPEPGPGEVLIRVRAAGMCHSDVGELDEPSWAANIHRCPITLGHEIAGDVVALGPGVDSARVGDRVGVHPLGATVPGYGRDGGYAAFHVAPVGDLVPLPEGMSFELGALGTDAGMTSHHGVVEVAGVTAGDRVGIIGLGGLGQIGARIAVLLGAEVHAADPSPDARRLGEELGAVEVVADAADLAGRGLDAVIDFAGFTATAQAAVQAIRVGGVVVMIGMGAHTSQLVTADVIHQKAVIRGSSGGTRADIASVYRYLAEGRIVPAVERLTFEQVAEGIDRLRDGKVTGRLVVMM
ncbi:alcohol dehydrogenase catalytic domain-containing protein [Rhodococcus sp. IEGM 1408]|uniref:alcohol dehydrogenase catalytic domain-containing protein n=1 Tax=Rhodococcus sp. IEGM 1408 TaxID=3082220 RepID=UPI0029557EE2|nr:zinc-binding dehydrogenase [Rhodococcus sp. IEGM 1408]MDV8002644.1 zinc-binding dehydrogenase [Rhodococcus sp. IEGM 1408]